MFDINDFDETLPGPWERDVKRLAASVEVAGRQRGFDRRVRRAAVEASVRSYRRAMQEFAGQRNLDVWYAHADVDELRARYDGSLCSSARFDRALTAFAEAYADQTERDHRRLLDATAMRGINAAAG